MFAHLAGPTELNGQEDGRSLDGLAVFHEDLAKIVSSGVCVRSLHGDTGLCCVGRNFVKHASASRYIISKFHIPEVPDCSVVQLAADSCSTFSNDLVITLGSILVLSQTSMRDSQ